MLESGLESKVVKWAEAQGGEAPKLVLVNERGFPDRTLLLPGGRMLLVELKRPGKSKKYEQQKKWVNRLQELGFVADFFDNLDDIERAYHDTWGIQSGG